MEEHDNEHNHEHAESVYKVKKGSLLRDKPWVVSTFVLGILVILLLAGNLFNFNITGNAVSANKAGENILNFAVSQGMTAEVVSVTSEGSFYKVILSIDGSEVPVYVTKDGKYFTSSLIPLITEVDASTSDTTTQTQEIPKSVKPSVELYVFTYCPYGTQAEKGIIPVVELLGDKIDFSIRQIGAMHDPDGCSGSACYESFEAKRQLCIEKNYPTKFLNYLTEFDGNADVGACKGLDTCVTPLINSIYTKLGISASKINTCMTTDGVTMYSTEEENSQSQGVSGSPTLIINGVKVSSARDSASYLDTICQAFSDGSVPTECGQQLSSVSPSPGFGTSSGGASSASC